MPSLELRPKKARLLRELVPLFRLGLRLALRKAAAGVASEATVPRAMQCLSEGLAEMPAVVG